MGIGIKMGGGGSSKVTNGVLEMYPAKTGTVPANTFVEFEEGTYSFPIQTVAATTSGYPAAVLSESSVLFLTENQSSIWTISGTTITEGPIFSVGIYGSLIAMLPTKAVTVSKGDGGLYGTIYDISGTTITQGASSFLTSASTIALSGGFKAIRLSETKFIVVFLNTSYQLMGVVCTVSENSITAGSAITISSSKGTAYDAVGGESLTEHSFICARQASSGDTLYEYLCTVSGDTITVETSETLSSSFYSYGGIVRLSDHRFITYGSYRKSTTSSYRYAICQIGKVSGSTITLGEVNYLSPSSGSYNVGSIKVNALSSDRIFVTYEDSLSEFLRCGVYSVSDLDAVLEGSEQTSLAYATLVYAYLLNNTKVLIFYTYEKNSYGMIANLPRYIKPSEGSIGGLTKSKATETVPGKVWMLND